ncbi:MAG: hypothetical protein HC836_23165 [Richelia sp. RM2_1_2]|nr:hypothetical protein [Richelia sp. RM2_1_2]
MTQIDSTKITGYAIVGPSNSIKLVSKVTGYTTIGPSDNIEFVSKITGYAVIHPLNSIDVVKTTGYAVIAELPIIPQNNLVIGPGVIISGGLTIKFN